MLTAVDSNDSELCHVEIIQTKLRFKQSQGFNIKETLQHVVELPVRTGLEAGYNCKGIYFNILFLFLLDEEMTLLFYLIIFIFLMYKTKVFWVILKSFL